MYFLISPLASFESIQMLVTKHKMTWPIADEVCTKEFQGTGYRHLAADILGQTQDYSLLQMKNFESVWLDALIYDLGCRGKKSKISRIIPFTYCLFYNCFDP
jgi:hypothetical protein